MVKITNFRQLDIAIREGLIDYEEAQEIEDMLYREMNGTSPMFAPA